MALLECSIEGGDIARFARLEAGGHAITEHLGGALDELATEMVAAVQDHMHFSRGYETGELRESVVAQRTGPLELSVSAGSGHAAFVEYGTGERGAGSGAEPGPGYSYGPRPGMEAEPYMAPAMQEMGPVIEQYLAEAVEQGLQEMGRL